MPSLPLLSLKFSSEKELLGFETFLTTVLSEGHRLILFEQDYIPQSHFIYKINPVDDNNNMFILNQDTIGRIKFLHSNELTIQDLNKNGESLIQFVLPYLKHDISSESLQDIYVNSLANSYIVEKIIVNDYIHWDLDDVLSLSFFDKKGQFKTFKSKTINTINDFYQAIDKFINNPEIVDNFSQSEQVLF